MGPEREDSYSDALTEAGGEKSADPQNTGSFKAR